MEQVNRPKVDWDKVIWFIGIAFPVAWVLFLLPLMFGSAGSPVRQAAMLAGWTAAMWAPGLAAVAISRRTQPNGAAALGARRVGPRRYYVAAWLIPPMLAALAGLLTVLFGVGRLDPTLSFINGALAGSGITGVDPGLLVLVQIGSALTIGPAFNTIFALGEELGWRAFLLPALEPLGRWKAIILTGVIWGVWHAPAILQGHNYPGHEIIGVPMMVVFTVLIGAVFSWLWFETGSPWAPALAHGSLNASAGLALPFLAPGVDVALGGTVSSAIGWIPIAILIALLAATHRLPGRPRPVTTDTQEIHATSA